MIIGQLANLFWEEYGGCLLEETQKIVPDRSWIGAYALMNYGQSNFYLGLITQIELRTDPETQNPRLNLEAFCFHFEVKGVPKWYFNDW